MSSFLFTINSPACYFNFFLQGENEYNSNNNNNNNDVIIFSHVLLALVNNKSDNHSLS